MSRRLPPLKKPAGLTAKQENFVHEYLKCGSATEAYLKSYNVKPTTSRTSTHTEACATLRKPAVASYLQLLRDRASDKTTLSLIESREILTDIARTEPDETTKQSDRIQAIRVDSQIGGYAAAQKHEVQMLGILAHIDGPETTTADDETFYVDYGNEEEDEREEEAEGAE